MNTIKKELIVRILTGICIAAFFLWVLYAPTWVFMFFIAMLYGIIMITEWPQLFSYREPGFWLLLPFYPLLSMLLIIHLKATGNTQLILFTVSLVTAHDIGSYIIGKRWGVTKISSLSPGKTWEGFIGGCVATYAVSLFFIPKPLTMIPVSLLLSTSALIGDLFESALKRRAGIKDTSSLLPGHGGILDRIDGILVAIPIAYLFLR